MEHIISHINLIPVPWIVFMNLGSCFFVSRRHVSSNSRCFGVVFNISQPKVMFTATRHRLFRVERLRRSQNHGVRQLGRITSYNQRIDGFLHWSEWHPYQPRNVTACWFHQKLETFPPNPVMTNFKKNNWGITCYVACALLVFHWTFMGHLWASLWKYFRTPMFL